MVELECSRGGVLSKNIARVHLRYGMFVHNTLSGEVDYGHVTFSTTHSHVEPEHGVSQVKKLMQSRSDIRNDHSMNP